MNQVMVVVGVGEIGGVFARGFLKCGYACYPVNRGTSMVGLEQQWPSPRVVLLAVGEGDLQSVLSDLPDAWRDRIVLIQNELLPRDWQHHRLREPTVVSVWFEKKKGQDVKIVVPSEVFGPEAALIARALDRLEIPSRIIPRADELLFQLVRKNLYILVSNICGLETGGTVSDLQQRHGALLRVVAADVIKLQEWLTGQSFDREQLIVAMLTAFDADPGHQCMGRSARARLGRALEQADQAGLAMPALRRLAGAPK